MTTPQEFPFPSSTVSDPADAEKLLRHYELMIHFSRDMILFIRREDGRILEANAAAEKAYGYSRDQLLTMTVYEIRHPEALETVTRQMDQADNGGILFETEHRRSDGSVFPVEVSSRGVQIDGSNILVSIIRDISRRKRAEKTLRDIYISREFHLLQLRALISQMTEGLVIFDPQGILLDMNPAALDIHGFEDVASLQRHLDSLTDVFELFDLAGNRLPTDEWPIGRVLRGESFQSHEVRVHRLDNGRTWIGSYGGTPVYDQDGNMLLAIVTLRDITDSKRMDEALRKSERQLTVLNTELEQRVNQRTAEAEQRALQLQQLALQLSDAEDRERRQIAMILHDDLQQYLAAIHFGLETLLPKDRIDSETAPRLQRLHRLIDNSIRKCRNLSHELSPPVLHQNGLLAALDWLVKDMEQKHGLAVTLNISPEAEPDSPVLASVLFRSIKELLFNSAKYSGTDTAVIEMRAEADQIRVTVRDAGLGCDVTNLKEKRGKEVGFGLFSIEERIHFLGGHVEIESAHGSGFCVTLSVPKSGTGKPAETAAEPAPEQTAATSTGRNGDTGRIRILLADDHAVMRAGLANLLEGEDDIDVAAEAENGQEALRLAGEMNPHVILMDVTMPVMDGIEATTEISRRYPHISIIGLSMHDDSHTRERMIDAGAAAYACKADAAQILIGEIRRVVQDST